MARASLGVAAPGLISSGLWCRSNGAVKCAATNAKATTND
jgi:hypothetical protein